MATRYLPEIILQGSFQAHGGETGQRDIPAFHDPGGQCDARTLLRVLHHRKHLKNHPYGNRLHLNFALMALYWSSEGSEDNFCLGWRHLK